MAYIDPGSGSMLYQLVLASLLGTALAFRNGLVSMIRRIFRK
jgi:hypothetical protein